MSREQKTIMIIEDEPDANELFMEMMRINGFRNIKTYLSPPDFSLFAREKPDLIILDIMMPDISGLEVLRYLRSQRELASLPVVVVSARATPGDINAGMEAGASVYLTKPVSYVDLKKAVDSFIPDP